ncbi:uracil-DNA glycosylase [Demequina sediminicola]|uniref:uracil-DNA glycosylase n=1 Tax=Demequina sediminicola TaxID=1095026 RepID=UPI0007830DFC|nr:uracil-DNA glycosylase [Demequina sediminicola]
MIDTWREHVADDWRNALEPAAPTLSSIGRFLDAEQDQGYDIAPHADAVFRAFREPLADARVLIIGQDPYPTPGDAVGLSFSVAPGRPMPRSLRNIAAELATDTGETLTDGDLSHWQHQGVVLLNRVLTVRAGKGNAGTHRGKGWEEVTAVAIEALAARGTPLVAVLWGKDAQRLEPALDGVPVVSSVHPSPLSARRGFFGSRPFSRVNAALQAQGSEPIEWGSPA